VEWLEEIPRKEGLEKIFYLKGATMAKTKNKKTAVEELNDILFDTLGEFVNPKCWEITPRTCGGKPDGHYLVLCDEHPGCDAYVKEAVDDVNRGIAGTKFEGKIHLYFPSK
jgi:hypothetical protein